MDLLQSIAATLDLDLSHFNTTTAVTLLNKAHQTYLSSSSGGASASPRDAAAGITYYTTFLYSLLSPYLSLRTMARIISFTSTVTQFAASADVWSLFAFAVLLFVGFRVLDYLRRMVMFWIMLAVKLVLVLLAVQAAVYAYNVGLERTVQDLGVVWGWIEGVLDATGTGASSKQQGQQRHRQRQGKGQARGRRYG